MAEDYKCPNCGKKLVKNGHTPSGKQRWICRDKAEGSEGFCHTTTEPGKPKRGRKPIEKKLDLGAELDWDDTLIITWAQNATPIHKGFLAGIKKLRDDLGATLMVHAGRYKNPTSRWTDEDRGEQWWYPEVEPFLINKRARLNKNLMLLADVNVQPTAQYPLSDLEGLSHGESSILGHPKRQLVAVATPQQRLSKVMWSTGACTIENYTDSKAGKKGEFHHVIGALVIKIKSDKIFHVQEITARKDGAFCFLDKAYFPDGSVKPSGDWLAGSIGDLHPTFADPVVIKATFDDGGLVDFLKPKKLFLHDAFDCYSGNSHHWDEPFIAIAKRKSGLDDVGKEVQFTADFIINMVKGRETHIVPSNHDDMLHRWMKKVEWRKDPTNAEFFFETGLYMSRNTVMTPQGAFIPDPFNHWLDRRGQRNIITHLPLDSVMVAGFEMLLHGDKGPNGARGSIRNLAKIGVKVISGHGHSMGIVGGHRRNGTCTYLDLDYTGPISSWLNGHTLVDPMGKSHAMVCIDGKFWA